MWKFDLDGTKTNRAVAVDGLFAWAKEKQLAAGIFAYDSKPNGARQTGTAAGYGVRGRMNLRLKRFGQNHELYMRDILVLGSTSETDLSPRQNDSTNLLKLKYESTCRRFGLCEVSGE